MRVLPARLFVCVRTSKKGEGQGHKRFGKFFKMCLPVCLYLTVIPAGTQPDSKTKPVQMIVGTTKMSGGDGLLESISNIPVNSIRPIKR